MITVNNIYKQYGGKHALNGLSFTAENGSVLGFIGPNGAGKSTAMRILCGVMPPTSGTVIVSGINLNEDSRAAREKIGYLPENAPLYTGMNVTAFLRYCGGMRGLAGKKLECAMGEAVEKCRLHDVLHEELEALSKGFRRRVCLAQAIMHKPENLVLDEPTDGLDPDQKREIRTLIDEIREHSAVIVSTHILEEIDAVCDSVLAIRGGYRVFYGSTAQFRALDPEHGVIVMRFDAFLEEPFRSLAGVELLALERGGESGTEMTIRARSLGGSSSDAVASLVNAASANGLKLLGLEQRSGHLDEVFANLASPGRGREEAESCITE